MVFIPQIPLLFPKHVQVSNPRLKMVYYIGLLLVGTLLGIKLWVYKDYASIIAIGRDIDVTTWVPTPPADKLDSISAAVKASSLCTQPHRADYMWGTGYNYTNHKCIDVCGSQSYGSGCLYPNELYIDEGPSQKFFVSHYSQEVFSPNPSERSPAKHFINTALEAMSITLSYSVWISPDVKKNTFPPPSAMEEQPAVSTIILNSQGEQTETLRPSGKGIEVSISYLLKLSGRADWLDNPQPRAGANVLPDAFYPQGPLGRISGIAIDVDVACYNSQGIPRGLDTSGIETSNGVCTAQVRPSTQPWTIKDVTLHSGTTLRRRVNHGIRVRIRTRGEFRHPDVFSIMNFIVSCLVLMRVPLMFTQFITTFLLGHLSDMYNRVIYERFDFGEQVAGMSARIMANSVAFLELEDSVGGFSKKRMAERLKESLRECKEMDADEINSFVDFCFHAMVNHKSYSSDESLHSEIITAFGVNSGGSQEFEDENHTRINIDSFMIACSSSDMIGFGDVVTLFDRNRKISCFEKWATPAYIKRNVFDVVASIEHVSGRESCIEKDGIHDEAHPEIQRAHMLRATTTLKERQNMTLCSVQKIEDIIKEKQRLDAKVLELVGQLVELQSQVASLKDYVSDQFPNKPLQRLDVQRHLEQAVSNEVADESNQQPLRDAADVSKPFMDNSSANPCGADTLQAQEDMWPPVELGAELSPRTVALEEVKRGTPFPQTTL